MSFGTLDTGAGGKTLTFTVSNSWDHPETITAVGLPSAPYTVRGLPRPGTVLAPQQSVTASVTYDPITAGADRAVVTVTSDEGSVSVPLTGAAVTGTAVLTVSPAAVAFGSVAVGTSVHHDLPHREHRQHPPHHLPGAAAPAGAFSVARPLPEGITLDPATSVDPGGDLHPHRTGIVLRSVQVQRRERSGPDRRHLHRLGTVSTMICVDPGGAPAVARRGQWPMWSAGMVPSRPFS